MQRVTNTTEFGIPLPNGIVIAAGKTRPVKAWDQIKLNPGVKGLLSAGALVVEEPAKPKRKASKPTTEPVTDTQPAAEKDT